jgi:probable O-glycosylation ligase (exosortase A-associated)
MRDIYFTLFLPFFIYYAFKSPYVSLYLWFWTSIYPIQNWLYGFALSFRVNFIFALITIIGYFVTLKNKPSYQITGLFVLVILFCLHSSLGVAINGIYDFQWDKFWDFTKAIVFFIFCTLMLRTKQHFEGALMFLALGFGYYGLMEALKFLNTGGSHNIYGILGPLGDNNKVALGLDMMIPLLLYLAQQITVKRVKQIIWVIIIGCAVAVLATASRGGLIALLFMAGYYWWTSGKSFSLLFAFCVVGLIAIPVLPDSWFNRMDTIETASTDSSFIARLTSWKINLLAALDHPFVGLGFNSTATAQIWQQYVPDLNSINFGVYTPPPTKGFVAHSIYFEVLGNQGIMGFILFGLILASTYLNINHLLKHHYDKNTWQHQLLKAVKVSLLTYCVAGSALSAAYFELLYFIIAIVVSLHIAAKLPLKKEQ